MEPRCLVCGAPLGRGAPFEKDFRKSEVCSQKCFEIFMTEDGVTEECGNCGYMHTMEKCPYLKHVIRR